MEPKDLHEHLQSIAPPWMQSTNDNLPSEEPESRPHQHKQTKTPSWRPCSECGREATVLEEGEICWDCKEKRKHTAIAAKQAAAIMEDVEAWADRIMFSMDLSKRELRARLDKIPIPIKRCLPKATVKAILEGEYPERGFGLGGNTGGGKTMAMAALLREYLKARARAFAKTPEKPLWNGNGIVWCSWPDEVTMFRAHATEDRTEFRIQLLKTCGLLILDDLGRERIRGSYADDWAASQLDSVVNTRYRSELPVFWSTNITEAQLVDLYGGALFSRLTSDNPLIWVDGLSDLRGAA